MKRKAITLIVLLSLLLQACTLMVWRPSHVDGITGEQLYTLVAQYKWEDRSDAVINIYLTKRRMIPK